MKSPRVVTVLASILALGLGAVGLVSVMTGPSSSDARPTGRSPAVSLELRQGGLGESTDPGPARLESELAAPRRAAMDAAAPRAEPRSSNETPVEAAAAVPATPEELAEFAEYVDATLAEIRKEKAAELLRDIERRNAALGDTLRALTDELALTPTQSERLRSLLRLQLDREAEYVWHYEEGADERALTELKANDLTIHLRELSRFLSARQLEAYRD